MTIVMIIMGLFFFFPFLLFSYCSVETTEDGTPWSRCSYTPPCTKFESALVLFFCLKKKKRKKERVLAGKENSGKEERRIQSEKRLCPPA